MHRSSATTLTGHVHHVHYTNDKRWAIVLVTALDGTAVGLKGVFSRIPLVGDRVSVRGATETSYKGRRELQAKAKQQVTVQFPLDGAHALAYLLRHVRCDDRIIRAFVQHTASTRTTFKLLRMSDPCKWPSMPGLQAAQQVALAEAWKAFVKAKLPGMSVDMVVEDIREQLEIRADATMDPAVLKSLADVGERLVTPEQGWRQVMSTMWPQLLEDLEGGAKGLLAINDACIVPVLSAEDARHLQVHARLQDAIENGGHTRIPVQPGNMAHALASDVFVVQDGHIGLRQVWEAESFLADAILAAHARNVQEVLAEFEGVDGIQWDPMQLHGIQQALSSGFSVIVGPPGSGKTTLLKGFLQRLPGSEHVLFSAPTNKALLNMQRAAGTDARYTYANLHQVAAAQPDNGWLAMQLEGDEPVTWIVDEMSMADVCVLARAWTKLAEIVGEERLHRILWLGDPDQLPPIGPGCPLIDVLRSDAVSVTRLTHVFLVQDGRQGLRDMIDAIRRGRSRAVPQICDASAQFVPFDGASDCCGMFEQVLRDEIDAGNARPGHPQDLLVITPFNELVTALSPIASSLMRSEAQGPRLAPLVDGRPYKFAADDRVVQCTNDPVERPGQPPRLNAMLGTVVSVSVCGAAAATGKVVVRFDDFPNLHAEYDLDEALDQLQPAAVVTVHRSQGSEAATVLFVTDDKHRGGALQHRELLYTAASRAKSRLVILCPEVFMGTSVIKRTPARRTWLQEMLMQGA